MPREIDRQAAAQKRSSRLLIGMAAFILIGVVVYMGLVFVTSRRTPANPDTRYTAENGVSVYYESGHLAGLPDDRGPHPRPGAGTGFQRGRRG